MSQSKNHATHRCYPLRFCRPDRKGVTAQQMYERMVLRHGVRQFNYVAKKKGKYAAGAARLWLVRVGVGEAAVVIETQALDPFHIAQSRRRTKSDQALFPGESLQQRGKRAKVLLAAEQA